MKRLLAKQLKLKNPQKILLRFQKYQKRSGKCILWTGYIDKDGYGRFWLNGRNHLAHRVSYAIKHNEAPAKQDVHHKCHWRNCVNAAHLTEKESALHRAMAYEEAPF